MDYGKEAYYKALEIEDRLSETFTATTVTTDGRAVSYEGGIGLISVNAIGDGLVKVYFDGVAVGETKAGSTSFTVTKSGEITFEIQSEMEITVCALAKGRLIAEYVKLVGDEYGGTTYALIGGEELTVYSSDGGEFTKVTTYVKADDYDLAVGVSGLLLGVIRNGKAQILLTADGQTKTFMLGSYSHIAVTSHSDGWLVAVANDEETLVFSLSASLAINESFRAHLSPTVKGLAFVKGSTTLAIEDGKRIIVRALA